jgi:N-acetylglucosamine kinase-like BadF-type ATPase
VLGRAAAGRWARAGGLGPLLGDEGSGFWLGREWLRATSADGNVATARRLSRSPDAVVRIAAIAVGVLRRARGGDRRARTIVGDAQAHLARFAADIARRLGLDEPVAVSWAGSVMSDAWFRRGVARALVRAGVRARWQAPRETPVVAAARLAARLAGGTRVAAAHARRHA